MSYQQFTRFRTTADFDREYLWNGASNQQAKNGVVNYDFPAHVRWKQLGKLPSTNVKMTLTFDYDLEIQCVLEVVDVHVRAEFHQAECYCVHKLLCLISQW